MTMQRAYETGGLWNAVKDGANVALQAAEIVLSPGWTFEPELLRPATTLQLVRPSADPRRAGRPPRSRTRKIRRALRDSGRTARGFAELIFVPGWTFEPELYRAGHQA